MMKSMLLGYRNRRTEIMKVLKKGTVEQTNEGIELVGWVFDAEGGAVDIDAMIDAVKDVIGELPEPED